MAHKRLSVIIEDELKEKLRASAEPFGGEWLVIRRIVNWWLSLSKREQVLFMFPDIRNQEPKRTDIGFKKGVKNGLPAL